MDNYRYFEKTYRRLLECHIKARRRKRKTKDEHHFEINLFENLYQLAKDIVNFAYAPSPGIAFITRKPVIREIFAAPYRDRIVHHLIYSMVEPYWEKHFILYSCSCRKNKGTLFAIKSVEKFIRRTTNNHQNSAVVFKYDLSGYFMSLPRKKLLQRAIRGLKAQYQGKTSSFDYRMLKYLWRKVILHDATIGVQLRGNIKDWNDLPRNKSLFFQPKGQGIVIGNLTSQLLSNIYLNDFDHYMSNLLPGCFYIRYVDDFMLIVDSKYSERIKQSQDLWQKELVRLNLRINMKKTYHQTVDKGIAFLGVVIFPHHTVIGKRLKKNMRIARTKYKNGEIPIESIVSYTGFTVHHNSYNLTKKFLEDCNL